MRSYKVMIVDDEAEVREGIAERIDWSALGFEVSAQAENGLEALEKAESAEVDILLTDIKMPFMDGLAMIGGFRALHPTAKVILFTGFDDRNYAREAIRLGVSEYVLKPVNVEELTAILRRVRDELDRETARTRDIERLRALYEKSLPSLREQFLGDLIWRRIPPDEVSAAMADYGFELDGAPDKLVMAFEISYGAGEAAVERELTPISIQQIIEETLGGRCRFALFHGFSQIVAITAWEGEDPVSRAVLLGNDICLRCKRNLNVRLSCGVGGAYQAMEDTHQSYAGAREALEYRGMADTGRAIYIGDMELPRPPADPDAHYDKLLLSAVKFGAPEQLETVIDDLIDRMRLAGDDPWQRQVYVVAAINSLNRIARRHGLESGGELAHRMGDLRALPQDDEGLRDWFYGVCCAMRERLFERRKSAPKALAEEARAYIAEHFADSSLNAERVCAHLHVSRSHFFSVFKRETGRSFVQFLTDMRLERAIELLHEPGNKTYTVALAVGYEEPNYFSHVFKQRFGMTPAQYRRQGGAG